ncbi:MAG: ATP-binding protein [Muricomes sp.]
MDLKTIQYWHKLEHFYPYILEEQHNENIRTYYINNSDNFDKLEKDNIPAGKMVRYYEVYLGIFKVTSALEVIAEQLDAQDEFYDDSNDASCFCKLRINPDKTFDKLSFRISSFPWAISRVKNKEISIKKWDEDFQEYERSLFFELLNQKELFNYKSFHEILEKISNRIGWNIRFDSQWMRIDCVIGNKLQKTEKDEEIEDENKQVDELIKANDLLNSFYVRDLERVSDDVSKGNYGTVLEEYLNHNVRERIDIENNTEQLFKVFNPQKLPYGKWPSGHSLRSMQQVAVNIAMDKEEFSSSIFSVNGPPGTGKTTLLRDIIAANIVERAKVLCEYDKPDDAFTCDIGSVAYNGFSNNIKDIDSRLKKYGILVASNNNAAVKNITLEMPEESSIKEDYVGKYTYFNEISNQILNRETWGLCAAALGNKRNCIKFMEGFWPLKSEEDDKFDFNRYLRELHTGKNKRTAEQCVKNWENAKNNFIQVYQSVEEKYEELEECYQRLADIRNLSKEKKKIETEYEKQINTYTQLSGRKGECDKEFLELNRLLEKYSIQKQEIQEHTAFFTIKYFFKAKHELIQQYKCIEEDIVNVLKQKLVVRNEIEKIESSLKNILVQKNKLEEQIMKYNQQISECKEKTEQLVKKYNMILPDEEFLHNLTGMNTEEFRDEAQNIAPWNGEDLNKLRETLFLEAMNLHKAFIENSFQMRIQLDAFNKILRENLDNIASKTFSGILFQSFMLVVPVISTTFASVGRFLKNIGKEEFGLLLIDEAGQALPQSAVGAIWRSQRAIVVGDPLQIEPVITIHDRTIAFLKRYFDQTDFIASKETSVQSLADESNRYVGIRSIEGKEFNIGSPLLVHGRCQRKIFDIANRIAYNDKMIFATKISEDTNCIWIDVKGKGENKHFVSAQIEEVLPLIIKKFKEAWQKADDNIPSLFIISPFRSVRVGIIKYLRENDFLYHKLCKQEDSICKKAVHSWIYSNIGTIHTFQGKEAETVIICLGVGSGDRGNGAVEWASNKPNILNVAVTRAKNDLYIVGDESKWASRKYFSDAYRICGKNKSKEI